MEIKVPECIVKLARAKIMGIDWRQDGNCSQHRVH